MNMCGAVGEDFWIETWHTWVRFRNCVSCLGGSLYGVVAGDFKLGTSGFGSSAQ